MHQNLLYRWLTLGNDDIQTLINRHHPGKPILDYIKPLTVGVRAQPANCCLLGLGGAGVAHALSSHLMDFQLDVVEYDNEIIELAHTYFMLDRLKHLKIIHQDANLFIQDSQATYQHIMIDLSDAHAFPEHCNNDLFFEHCRRLLLPEGTLAINLANLHEQWPVLQHIRTHFKQAIISLPVKGSANMVILASRTENALALAKLLKKNQQLKQLSWDSHWGCIAEI
ncbi:spermidine synthase [Legionella oakridgensis ATCC 33761 = DSM 21215]|uniref:Spermidine synthase n=2 Tax=Legionella oakridgensis TaxID=29423 RepID=W0BFQ9_9GAMM|nr:fused MFS/spermidine synthase [Legionella oakridgensis]AHE67254.1 spermidine synthase [Legionella oakridgensis ATCC 33761 = DSM 21215]ETO93212.1 spermidine synthase [Legionella oakridgensis RV-2-2007]KTD37953.1 spermidine synthase [Legionella oakridgensis]STY20326.1 spermidine synthase [Legionella longbeachae]